MICLKNIRIALIGKRVLISWVIIAVIFSAIGFAIGSITSKSLEQPIAIAQREALIFGKPNGKLITDETPCEWVNGNLNFIPLDVSLNEDLQEFSFQIENEPTNKAYKRYQEYCLASSLQPMSNIEFSKQVNRILNFHIKDQKINGKKCRIFVRND